MIQSNQKTSLKVPFELPKFISEDPNYTNFVLFLQAYYEWMEQQGNVLDFTKSIKTYMDVDTTTDEFLDYYMNDFMSYFPQDIMADPVKVLKIAKQLYQTKGTPASYQFLFRVLYNTDVDFFFTKDAVLKASAGKWYVPRSLKLATSNPNFLKIANLRVFGQTSKSIATIEAAVFDGLKTEVFISNIERLFQSGETVIIVDSNNQPVLFDGNTLTATIVGQISQVLINPNYRGLNYHVNDPVVIYGGLNPNTPNPIGASAEIGAVTSGGVQRVTVTTEGYGYTPANYIGNVGSGNTNISFGNISPTAGVIADVGLLDLTHSSGLANVGYIPVDSIELKKDHYIGNIAFSHGANFQNTMTGLWSNGNYNFANVAFANANTTLAQAFTFTTLNTAPILSVIVQNQGGGITTVPTVAAQSLYNSDNPLADIGGTIFYQQTNLATLGVLAPIQIVNAGYGYQNNDTIIIADGSGKGATANILHVNSSGAIINVGYTQLNNHYPTGGMGYNAQLPKTVFVAHTASGTISSSNTSNTISGNGTSFTTQLNVGSLLISSSNVIIGTVQSISNANSLILTANASNTLIANSFYLNTAQLVIPGILGAGASFSVVSNRIGSVTSINLIDNGEDYISDPQVSLSVQDLIVSNVALTGTPIPGDIIYQGANTNNATYLATVDFISILEANANPANSIYQMRVYNHTSKPRQNTAGIITPLKIDRVNANIDLVPNYGSNQIPPTFSLSDSRFDSANGVITYGDGNAEANATFLNGLVIGSGQYLDTSGQPSSFDVLQSTQYNNFTYEITLEKEIAKYRDVLLNLLHPAGMQVIGRFAMKSNTTLNFNTMDVLNQGLNLYDLTGAKSSNVSMYGSFTNPSNNIVQFNNLSGANLGNIIFANTSTIRFLTANNIGVESLVIAVNSSANTITLQDNVWLSFANVAYGVSNTGNNSIINIEYLTNSYNIVNNGLYSNTMYPLMDIIYAGDTIQVNNATQVVESINYSNGAIYLQGALSNGANGLISVTRSLNSTNVQIFGPSGTQYFPEITDENGNSLTTENGTVLLLG
jgi:hypothetical protein